MRPSDVPTYVEAGAADVGITGKDVLTEQSERDVYELLDLGYGPCTMVLATVDGPDPAAEALRRLGVMRVATKYPKTAQPTTSSATGRQAEIVEVKGSVELAPLTGLVEAIVDLTATGTTLRENGLVVREEIFLLHRAADRQPGRAQAQGAGDRRARRPAARLARRCALRVERLAVGDDPGAAAAQARALAPGRRVGRRRGDRDRRGRARRRRRRAARARRALRRRRRRRRCASTADELATPPGSRRRGRPARSRSRTSRSSPTPASASDSEVTLPQGHAIVLREVPVRRAGDLRPRRPRAATRRRSSWASSPRAPPASRRSCVATPPPVHPVIRGAARCCGVDEVYAMGGAHAVAALAYGTETIARVDVIAGPGNLYVQEAKRQVSGERRDRRVLRPQRRARARRRRPPTRGSSRSTCSPRASTGPGRVVAAASDDRRAARRRRRAGRRARGRPPDVRSGGARRSPTRRRCTRRSPSPRRSRPSTSSSSGRPRSASRRACARAGCVFVGAAGATAFGDYVAGSNHCLPTGGAARFASGLSPRVFRRRVSEVHLDDAVARARRRRRARSRGPRASPVHAESMEARASGRIRVR